MGLMCLSLVTEVFREKARDGHCYTHKREIKKPCRIGGQFHAELFKRVVKSFENMVKLIEEKPIKIPD